MKAGLTIGVQCVGSLALALVAAPVVAQSAWLDQEPGEFSVEVLRPSLEGPGGLAATSLATFATASVRVGEGVALVVELPISRLLPDFPGTDAVTALGNPYVGVRSISASDRGWRFGVGGRVPIADDRLDAEQARWFGGSNTDRLEAFAGELGCLDIRGRYVLPLGGSAYVSARLGAVLDLPLRGDVDPEAFALYGARGWVQSGGVRMGTGVSGRMWVTQDVAFGQWRALHDVGLWVDYDFGRLRPGIRFQMPVGDRPPWGVNSVVGITAQYALH
jgi:hypothetical protein